MIERRGEEKKRRRGEEERRKSPHLLFSSSKMFAVLVGLLISALAAAVWLGSEKLSFFELTEAQAAILFDIRLPRVLLGACVGASLAVAGASLQSLLRNPLAEPYLLGVSNGAALGTMLAFVFFANFEFARPVCAIAGAGLATIAVYQMAKSRAGMNVERLVLAAASALVGISVAASGSVGYVGLIVPHLIRLIVGSDNRLVIPFSAIAGAIFVVLADTVARTAIAPRELPVGAITALIGAPMFIYLLRKS